MVQELCAILLFNATKQDLESWLIFFSHRSQSRFWLITLTLVVPVRKFQFSSSIDITANMQVEILLKIADCKAIWLDIKQVFSALSQISEHLALLKLTAVLGQIMTAPK